MKKTELKPKLVSLVLVALLLCSIFTGAMGTDVRSGAVLSEQSSNRGNAGYESWYYYVADMVYFTPPQIELFQSFETAV